MQPCRRPARHERRARRRADRRGDIRRREPQALRREPIEVRGAVLLAAVDTEIVDAEIVSEDEDDVRRPRLCRRCRRQVRQAGDEGKDRGRQRRCGASRTQSPLSIPACLHWTSFTAAQLPAEAGSHASQELRSHAQGGFRLQPESVSLPALVDAGKTARQRSHESDACRRPASSGNPAAVSASRSRSCCCASSRARGGRHAPQSRPDQASICLTAGNSGKSSVMRMSALTRRWAVLRVVPATGDRRVVDLHEQLGQQVVERADAAAGAHQQAGRQHLVAAVEDAAAGPRQVRPCGRDRSR